MTRKALALVATAAVCVAFASAAQGVARGCPVCGRNLIANPGAESGKGTADDGVVPVPGWKGKGGFTAAQYAWSGGDVNATSPGPSGRGKNYFYGGPASAVSTGTQTVTLSGAAGHKATLSGWIGGYDSQGDSARLTVTFLGSSGQSLGTLVIGPVTQAQRAGASELLLKTAAATVPAGTASATVVLKMVRAAGSDNDGMADNLSLVLS